MPVTATFMLAEPVVAAPFPIIFMDHDPGVRWILVSFRSVPAGVARTGNVRRGACPGHGQHAQADRATHKGFSDCRHFCVPPWTYAKLTTNGKAALRFHEGRQIAKFRQPCPLACAVAERRPK